MSKLVCIVKKSKTWLEAPSGRSADGYTWQEPLSRTVCGKLIGLTTVKGGDIRNMVPVARVRAQGKVYIASPRDLKFKGTIRL